MVAIAPRIASCGLHASTGPVRVLPSCCIRSISRAIRSTSSVIMRASFLSASGSLRSASCPAPRIAASGFLISCASTAGALSIASPPCWCTGSSWPISDRVTTRHPGKLPSGETVMLTRISSPLAEITRSRATSASSVWSSRAATRASIGPIRSASGIPISRAALVPSRLSAAWLTSAIRPCASISRTAKIMPAICVRGSGSMPVPGASLALATRQAAFCSRNGS